MPSCRSSSRSARSPTRLTTLDCDLAPARALLVRLESDVLPHELADEQLLVPLVERALQGAEATAALSRTHAEIAYQVSRVRRLLEGVDDGDVQPEDAVELRRLLYGLYAVLRLHNAQEEEGGVQPRPEPGRLSSHSARRRPPRMPTSRTPAECGRCGWCGVTPIADSTSSGTAWRRRPASSGRTGPPG